MRFRLPERHFSGFIFDCDGTLADTMPLHFEAWRAALRAHAAPFEFTWPLFMRRAGMTQERTVEELNLEFGCALPAKAVADLQHEQFRSRIHQVRPIVEVVDYARRVAAEHPVAVASGGERQAVLHTLQLIGVAELFEVVVVAADVARGKPAPDLFLLAARRLGVPPEHCVVFEDAELGLDAARAAGMQAVLVQSAPP